MAAVTPEPYLTDTRRALRARSACSLGAAPGEFVVAAGAVQGRPLLPRLVGGLGRQLGEQPASADGAGGQDELARRRAKRIG